MWCVIVQHLTLENRKKIHKVGSHIRHRILLRAIEAEKDLVLSGWPIHLSNAAFKVDLRLGPRSPGCDYSKLCTVLTDCFPYGALLG